ncbi:MAG: type IX secretion system outer membrane channel protein PorV [Bacteroidales bacterium]|nr:type IX secretion system outer membrane channel protein PorV [Bacteroidales bacterium]MDD6731887.1 type IX secretion system outer membrane channel protein PorV [Bacteroidales bacterium]MDY4557244.1 type IX secretion system outer membrane channel protein PorV [Alloprevotella sp.]
MKYIISFLSLFFSFLVLCAEDEVRDQFNPVRTAVVSQTIAPDARAGGMGDVGAATDPDVHSQYWNPAKYPFTISRAGFAINYTPWLRKLTTGIALLDAVGYVRLGDYQALSGSIRYFTLGEVNASDGMTVKPYEFGVDLAYSRMLSEKFSASVGLRYLYSDITGHYDDNSTAGSAFAADVAMFYNTYVMMGQRECQLSWGLNINNIGSKISYGDDRSYFIPTNLRLGLSYLIPLNEYNRISFSADANKLLVPSMPLQGADELDEDYQQRLDDEYYNQSPISGIFKSFGDSERGFKGELEEIQWSIGAEYTYNDKFTLRAGYHHESKMQGNRKYATVGAGFKLNVLSVDAGYVIATEPSNPLDQTMRVSLTFDMDGIRDLFGRR